MHLFSNVLKGETETSYQFQRFSTFEKRCNDNYKDGGKALYLYGKALNYFQYAVIVDNVFLTSGGPPTDFQLAFNELNSISIPYYKLSNGVASMLYNRPIPPSLFKKESSRLLNNVVMCYNKQTAMNFIKNYNCDVMITTHVEPNFYVPECYDENFFIVYTAPFYNNQTRDKEECIEIKVKYVNGKANRTIIKGGIKLS